MRADDEPSPFASPAREQFRSFRSGTPYRRKYRRRAEVSTRAANFAPERRNGTDLRALGAEEASRLFVSSSHNEYHGNCLAIEAVTAKRYLHADGA